MNNILFKAKQFLRNKNTVTIIGIILVIGILYFGYHNTIKKATSPVSGVPVAAVTIQPRTEIKEDMVEYISVAKIILDQTSGVCKNKACISGKYSNYNTVIPQGSLFYLDALASKEDLPDAAFVELESGDIPYNFPVTMNSTYGNSIYPGNYIDIYMKAFNEDGILMVGKLIENIKVLAVKDSQGRNVFENSQETRTPSNIIFGLKAELNILLRKASYMNAYSVELFPVPHGSTLSSEAVSGATQVSSQTLKEFINANTVANDEITASSITEENTLDTETASTTTASTTIR